MFQNLVFYNFTSQIEEMTKSNSFQRKHSSRHASRKKSRQQSVDQDATLPSEVTEENTEKTPDQVEGTGAPTPNSEISKIQVILLTIL